jgi:hypothetical protein
MTVYKKIRVKIKGLTPLLMNRLNPDDLNVRTTKRLGKPDFEGEAERSAYIDKINGKKQLYIPSEAIFRCILNASTFHRIKRQSFTGLLSGTIRIEPEKIPLGTAKYEIDIRAVVIQRSRVLKARAKIPNWEAEFFIIYNNDYLSQVIDKLEEIIKDAGIRFGLLDWRPQKKGNFGTFEVVSFEFIEGK